MIGLSTVVDTLNNSMVGGTEMSTQKNSLTIKDLVTTGIFSALCFILVLLGGVFFGANPVLTFWMPVGSALLAGPVFLLLIAKVPKHPLV